jgi:energy-coupling factor transport system permease protein
MVNVTIGNYYPENSIIHRLDPRVKLFSTFIWILSVFLTNNFFGYFLLLLYLLVVVKVSKIPFGKLLKGLKPILAILLFSVIVNVLLTKGQPLFSWGSFYISKEGVMKGGFLAIRLVYLVLGTSVMTLTTTPNDLADGLEKSLGF